MMMMIPMPPMLPTDKELYGPCPPLSIAIPLPCPCPPPLPLQQAPRKGSGAALRVWK